MAYIPKPYITKKSDKEKINWITKKKKTDDSKFYGYTGPVKPSGYIQKKSKYITKKSDKDNSSYGYSGKPRDVKKKSKYITYKGD